MLNVLFDIPRVARRRLYFRDRTWIEESNTVTSVVTVTGARWLTHRLASSPRISICRILARKGCGITRLRAVTLYTLSGLAKVPTTIDLADSCHKCAIAHQAQTGIVASAKSSRPT